MSFSQSVRTVLARYVTFTGRASRSEYWWWVLANLLVQAAALGLDVLVNARSVLVLVVLAGLFLPSMAVAVRRLHDTDRAGWWLLIGFLPVVGGLVLLVFAVTDGTPGANRFGPRPALS